MVPLDTEQVRWKKPLISSISDWVRVLTLKICTNYLSDSHNMASNDLLTNKYFPKKFSLFGKEGKQKIGLPR